MADMTDDDFILDELASAYLDDEVTADERVAIEADPRALARVAALRAVRVTLQADVGQVDEDLLEAALATALAAHRVAAGVDSTAAGGPVADPGDGQGAGSSSGPSDITSAEPPVDLAAARRRRAGRIWKPVLAVAGAAAIGVAAITGVVSLAADGGGDDSASEVAVTSAASGAGAADANADIEDLDAATGAAPAESEAGTDPATGGGDATRETISEIGVAEVEDTPLLSTPDAESAAETTESTEAASTQAAGAAPALTTEQQLAAFSAETEPRTATAPAPGASSSSSPCPDLGYPAGAVVWRGTPGDLYLSVPTDEDSPALATVATVDCVILVSVRIATP